MTIARRPLMFGLTAVLVSACGARGDATAESTIPDADRSDAAVDDSASSTSPAPPAGAPSPEQEFYVDPASTPLLWAQENASDPSAQVIEEEIAGTPLARWFGNWTEDITSATDEFTSGAAQQGQLPIMVAYNMPGRDACGGHSGGGAGSPDAYDTWIDQYVTGIGGNPAVVVLEPDALGDYECMTDGQIAEREHMLKGAIERFGAQAPNAWVYVDAGNAGWVSPDIMAERLHGAGAGEAHGFAVNVSNYRSTEDSTDYARAVNEELEASYGYTKPFVVDTSRNGKGTPDTDWCNPAGQQVGERSQWSDDAEMLLWIKTPGESDGDCGVGEGTEAGDFLPEIAVDLVHGT